MRTTSRAAAVALLAAFAVSACTGSGATPAPATPAPATPEASAAAPASPSPTPDACATANLKTVSAGKLTIGTDNPAYPPYFSDATKDPAWELGNPTNGQGFESAVAYAVADKLGFAPSSVSWIAVKFDNSYAPGATKPFDFDINQVSYTPVRAESVDLSDGYYSLTQALVTFKDSKIAAAKSIADLAGFQFGAQAGTTSLDTINNVIKPTKEARVYDSNDAAIAALKAKQIDGIVVDLPTAFYMTAAQMDNGVIVGQFPAPAAGGEHFSLVLAKGNPLTACVNKAIAALTADGTLAKITQEWLADKANAPVFQP
jgi:polar amino acid transport system substrate-binding protein